MKQVEGFAWLHIYAGLNRILYWFLEQIKNEGQVQPGHKLKTNPCTHKGFGTTVCLQTNEFQKRKLSRPGPTIDV